MNLKKMMQQAAKMQEQMQTAQAELADKTVTATAGGGKVTVVANGAGDVVSIKIDKSVVDPEDVEMLEDLILSGVQKAIAEGKDLAQSEMSKLTAGLGLPPAALGGGAEEIDRRDELEHHRARFGGRLRVAMLDLRDVMKIGCENAARHQPQHDTRFRRLRGRLARCGRRRERLRDDLWC